MRALFQRKRGRDLFDLYWTLTAPSVEAVDPQRIVESFRYYMEQEGRSCRGTSFLAQLEIRMVDRGLFGYGAALA